MKNKKWKIKFSDRALKQIDDMPDKAYEKLEKFIKGIKTGSLNPKLIGHSIEWVELKTKLKCPKCKSSKVEWLLDKNSNIVDFHCSNCDETFWMTYKEYKKAVKRNPDKIIF